MVLQKVSFSHYYLQIKKITVTLNKQSERNGTFIKSFSFKYAWQNKR